MNKQVIASRKIEVTSAMLCVIASVGMLIDHIGSVILLPYLLQDPNNQALSSWYHVCKEWGIAFPIYAFLLIEGFKHTSSRLHYFLRLLIFSIPAEMAFDCAHSFNNKLVVDWSHQSIFVTLILAFICIWLAEKIWTSIENVYQESVITYFLAIIIWIVITIFFAYIAVFAKCDYDAGGIIMISVMWLSDKLFAIPCLTYGLGVLAHIPFFNTAYNAFIFLPIIFFYHGKKGKRIKLFGYWYYPGHLLLLVVVSIILFGL